MSTLNQGQSLRLMHRSACLGTFLPAQNERAPLSTGKHGVALQIIASKILEIHVRKLVISKLKNVNIQNKARDKF